MISQPKRRPRQPRRIGIYAGTFDPVHAGHVSFAVQALEAANLDAVYFLPERRPRGKTGCEHFGHRSAMLLRATRPHRRLRVLELEDVNFSVATTLPRLRRRFAGDQLVFLVGSDVAQHMPLWPGFERLCRDSKLLVGMRAADNYQTLQAAMARWPRQPRDVTVIESFAPSVSSRGIREALRSKRPAPGMLKSVERYSNRNWLYISLA